MTLLQLGHLELCTKTFLTNKGTKEGTLADGLEICQWDWDYQYKWAIGSFKKDEDGCWEFHEYGSRLSGEDIEPYDFFTLLKTGRQIMDLIPVE